MAHSLARTCFVGSLLGLAFGLVGSNSPAVPPSSAPFLRAEAAQGKKLVFLGCDFSDEDVLMATAVLAAPSQTMPLLVHTAEAEPQLKGFFQAYRPDRVVPIGYLSEEKEDLEQRLGVNLESPLEWDDTPPHALWRALIPKAKRVIVCRATPRGLLLQATCLAGVLEAPLYIVHENPGEMLALRRQLVAWNTQEVFDVAGAVSVTALDLPRVRRTMLADEQAVAACYLKWQAQAGPIETLVVANPSDSEQHLGRMAAIAPWVALQKRAALLLTNSAGTNTNTLVHTALRDPRLRAADSLILVASLKAIPPERRPNPVAGGKDAEIEMEPLTPVGSQPFTFATGRLANWEHGLVFLNLARQRLLAEKAAPRKALIVSNPTGGLPLLETFSRNTAREFANGGYQTTALFGHEVSKDKLRRLLPEQDIFLWEGHHSTMTKDYEMPGWTEPLQPSVVFLQSCLALCRAEAYPLLERGAVAVVGSSTRTFSASGGACSMAFFDSLLYEQQSLGGALRHAKNFLLAYSLLKEQRLGSNAKLGGANLRSAWAFTLWGDPTLKLPPPHKPSDALPTVRHEVRGKTIFLWRPEQNYDKVSSEKYQAHLVPNARLAGLVNKPEGTSDRHLVPLLFAEVHLPHGPRGTTPQLQSRVPAKRWVFCWDARRRCGYLLVEPREQDRGELRFHVEWKASERVATALR